MWLLLLGKPGKLSLSSFTLPSPPGMKFLSPPPPKSQKIRLFCMDGIKEEESTELDESLLSKSSIDVYKNDTVRVLFRFLDFYYFSAYNESEAQRFFVFLRITHTHTHTQLGDMVLDDDEIRNIWDTLSTIAKTREYISRDQLKEILGKLKIRCEEDSKIDEFFETFDTDHDDRICFEEFREFAQIRESELIELFYEIDRDKDGQLETDEVMTALKKHGLHASLHTVKDFIKRLDRDHSGTISYNEFRELAMLFPSIGVSAILSDGIAAQVIGYYTIPKHDHKTKHPLVVLASGGIAGLVSRTTTAPADRLKVMMQAGKSSSILEASRFILKQDGVKGFWTGNGTNVMKIVPESACKFYAYEFFKSFAKDPDDITIFERLAAGSSAGVVAQTAIYPLEVVKCRLAVAPPGTYNSVVNCLMKIIQESGFRGVFSGLSPSLMGIIPYAGVDLAVYGTVKDRWIRQHPNQKPNDMTVLCMGAFSSFCGQIIAYPLQLVRTKLQSSGVEGMEKYNGMMDCVRRVMKSDGPLGFYRGIGANFMKGIPAVGIGYVAYERARRYFGALV